MDHTPLIELMKSRYAAQHQAEPRVTYQTLLGQNSGARVGAALGYRRAGAEALFLEAYLDAPVEDALMPALGRAVDRNDIIEIGNLASCNATAMIALWARTANDLGHEAEIAVAVLTAPLRRMFARLGVRLIELAKADPARVPDDGSDWGRYYELEPMVCAGLIAEGQHQLNRFAARIERQAA